jgi:hypothetical protein
VLVEKAGLRRDEQIALLRKIAATLVSHGPMVNELLRVGDDESMTFENSPAR